MTRLFAAILSLGLTMWLGDGMGEGSLWEMLSPEEQAATKRAGLEFADADKAGAKAAPEEEFLGWQLVERGAPLSAVLRHDSLGKTESAASAPKEGDGAKPSSPNGPADPALQRAQDVLAALQVLGGVPLLEKR